MSKRLIAAALALLAALGAAMAVGRWEESRALQRERARIDAVYSLIGRDVAAPSLSGYRIAELDCLFYDIGSRRYSVTLCFDRMGRLVESADRRSPEPQYSSIVRHPESAPATIDRLRLRALLRRIGALPL